MVNLVLGGFLTLVATLIVQIVVIPRVQARTRRRERWEADAIELFDLIELQMPLSLRLFQNALFKNLRHEHFYDLTQQSVFETQQEIDALVREATNAMAHDVSQAATLSQRVAAARPKNSLSPAELGQALDQFREAIILVLRSKDPLNDEWDQTWQQIEGARSNLRKKVGHYYMLTLRSPRRTGVRHWWLVKRLTPSPGSRIARASSCTVAVGRQFVRRWIVDGPQPKSSALDVAPPEAAES